MGKNKGKPVKLINDSEESLGGPGGTLAIGGWSLRRSGNGQNALGFIAFDSFDLGLSDSLLLAIALLEWSSIV